MLLLVKPTLEAVTNGVFRFPLFTVAVVSPNGPTCIEHSGAYTDGKSKLWAVCTIRLPLLSSNDGISGWEESGPVL